MDKDLMNFEANFSVLDRYGTDVTKEDFVTDPAIGRDQQIKDLILVLLTPEKSAILIGKPGIGKTAIVEGLAYRIQQNDVPEALQGYTIINIKTASLLGTMPSGESKVQKMIDELKTKDKMILFIDEIHMLIGSTETSSLDFANIFKEGLGRGSIKVIGATTTEEYERYILRDKAFTRRFQKIEVPEPSREETIKIMMGTLPKFEKQTGRKMKYTSFIQERIMSFIVDITSEYKRVYALGSRYPDVCLTLLKQAFSYTVYDNREYMDIFDIRKAIENSKNIYPDVIKKELPNFDKMFNDIILEEKGEKPIEEWRKDNTKTRSEIEASKQDDNDNEEDSDGASVLNKMPDNVDKIEVRDNKISSTGKLNHAKIGSTAVSIGLKEKLNKVSNTKALDDILLSEDMNILMIEEPKEKEFTNYTVTKEISPEVDDDYLLQRPIESNVDIEIPKEEKTFKYRNNQRKKKEGSNMWNNDYRPERMDISSQNFDKYHNFFHQDDNSNNQNNENENRMDLLMSGSNNFNPNGIGNGPMDNQNYGPMAGPMGGPMGPMDNQSFGPMAGPMGGPMVPMQNQGPMNNQNFGQMPGGLPPMPGPMGNPMGPMDNQNFGPMPNQGPMNNQFNPNGGFLNNVTNNYTPNNDGSFFGSPAVGKTVSQVESLFGAPMYGNENVNNEPKNESFNPYDELLADNMSLKNGEIVKEFPTFEKLNNLNNITTSSNQEDSNQGNSQMGFNMNNMGNMGMNMVGNPNMPMNGNRNWTYINNNQNYPQQNMNMGMNMNANNSSFFQKNILEDAKKQKESSETTITSPTNNKDYYEDMKSGEFVNFSDLSKGKIPEEDTNKYMGVQTEANKPQYDLNLENNVEEEDKFDDFYE